MMGRRTMEEKDPKNLPPLPVLSPGFASPVNEKGTTGIRGRIGGIFSISQTPSQSRLRRIIAYAVVATLIVIAIVLGAVVGTRQHKSTGSGASGNSSTPTFPQDPKLHNSFWGIAYTPYGAIDCTATQANVTKDIKQLSQLTTRLRLYAADCNVTSLILQAIQDTHVNMSIYAGIYVNPDLPSYNSQVAQLDAAFSAYGTSHILGVTVGNEYILNAQSRGDTTANVTSWLISRLNAYKSHLQTLSISLPVGTSDAAGTYLGAVVSSTDYLMVNIHPWFSANTYEQAAWFSSTYMKNIIEPMVNATWPSQINGPTPKQLFQGEFGWPSASDSAALGVNVGGSSAGIPEMQRVLDDWVCPSNQNGTQYFWFEAYDEPWKSMYGGVEQHWGLFDSAGNLKNITIPNCSHS